MLAKLGPDAEPSWIPEHVVGWGPDNVAGVRTPTELGTEQVKEPAPADASPAAQRPWTPRRRPVRTLRPASIKRSSEDVREGLTNWREVARGLRRWSTPACDLEAMMRDTVGTTPFRPAARAARRGLSRRRPGGQRGR